MLVVYSLTDGMSPTRAKQTTLMDVGRTPASTTVLKTGTSRTVPPEGGSRANAK